jgi:hypothetical protein
MVTISPVQIWKDGVIEDATKLSVRCINDNLSTSATFLYILFDSNLKEVRKGNLTMSGSDYNNWVTNEYAYDWVASKINLTIIPETN